MASLTDPKPLTTPAANLDGITISSHTYHTFLSGKQYTFHERRIIRGTPPDNFQPFYVTITASNPAGQALTFNFPIPAQSLDEAIKAVPHTTNEAMKQVKLQLAAARIVKAGPHAVHALSHQQRRAISKSN